MAVVFHPDGIHLLGGGDGGVGRWRLSDGQEVGKQTGMKLRAISVSRDSKWIVCGTREGGASVWDAEMHEKVIDVEGARTVYAVDVSPDSTRFATGTGLDDNKVSIWGTATGKRLVGPLQHDDWVVGTRFSPNGEHIATFCRPGGLVRIFDSHNGDDLINIKTNASFSQPITPLAWSKDGQQIFTTSDDHRIKSFTVSTGSQLAQSSILDNDYSISLAGNGKFIATVASNCISFLDSSTLAKIGTAIADTERMWSIAVSLDSRRVATGRADGKIVVHDLGKFLPDSYGPFHVSICPFIALAYWISTTLY